MARLRFVAACVIVAGVAGGSTSVDASQAASAAEVKAAYLLNFIRFTTWPSEILADDAPIVTCVSGDDSVADALEDQIRGQRIAGHAISVQRLKRDAALASCHLLYWSSSKDARGHDSLVQSFKQPILTVSDSPDFAALGGIVNFFIDSGRMRFAVNPAAADRVQLRISSKLLALAKIVKDAPHASIR
jgi:hypothetical protein